MLEKKVIIFEEYNEINFFFINLYSHRLLYFSFNTMRLRANGKNETIVIKD